MNLELLSKIINSIGLIFDIAGASFVAWEVVKQFKGEQYGTSIAVEVIALPPNKTPEYKQYELTKYRKMRFGLILLIIGFLLQVSSNWVYLLCPTSIKETTKTITEIHNPPKPIATKSLCSKPPAIVVPKPKTTKPIIAKQYNNKLNGQLSL